MTHNHAFLFLRLSLGITMLLAHGLPKIEKYARINAFFPDPFGIGSAVSLSLVIFAEALCSILLLLGIWTRVAIIPLIITMATAFFIIHSDDPFSKKELSLMYLIGYISLLIGGSGAFALLKPKNLPNTKFWNWISEKN